MGKRSVFLFLFFLLTLQIYSQATPIILLKGKEIAKEKMFDVALGLTGGCYLWNEEIGDIYISNLGGILRLTKPLFGETNKDNDGYISYFEVGINVWAAYGNISSTSTPVFGLGPSIGFCNNFINFSIGWSGIITDKFYNTLSIIISGGNLVLNN